MKIVSLVNRELTEAELASIRHYIYYTDGNISFACLREGVMVDLDEEESEDVQVLEEATRCCMMHALSVMPDVWPYYMDDGHHMVQMNGPVTAFSSHPVSWLSPAMTFALRAECLDACETGEIIAIVIKEE